MIAPAAANDLSAIMQRFHVRVKTADGTVEHSAIAPSSYDAYAAAADRQDDAPFAISVVPA